MTLSDCAGPKPLRVALTLLAALALSGQEALQLSGDIWGAHDPSIIEEGNTWYVFTTGHDAAHGQLPIRCSTDLKSWHLCGHVFDAIPSWIQKDSPGTRDLWAPDISFYKGEYRLYYAYSLFGKNTSGIALATNKTLDPSSPDYKWVDHGLVLRSTASDNYNAIDPNFVFDGQGRTWLAFGSFWSGIKLRRLNSEGLASTEDKTVYSLAARKEPRNAAPPPPGLPANWQAIEAPFIIHHDSNYYLFVSWDLCCRGSRSTYRTVVGRSKEITGPYADQSGTPMLDGGGTTILTANSVWLGPGGESAYMDSPQNLLVFHAYDAKTGKPALQISTINWLDGWPHVALATQHAQAPQ
jgi:arabinan endo-1,5-alpha-L-arabinosidase